MEPIVTELPRETRVLDAVVSLVETNPTPAVLLVSVSMMTKAPLGGLSA